MVSAKLRELLPTERDPHNSMTFGPHADPELLLSRLSFSHFADQVNRTVVVILMYSSSWAYDIQK